MKNIVNVMFSRQAYSEHTLSKCQNIVKQMKLSFYKKSKQ